MTSIEKIFDKGPWIYGVSSMGHFVESEDFNHDVRLYINGDFESENQKKEYGEWLAWRLNQ